MPGTAHADTTICTESIKDMVVVDLEVPDGKSCLVDEAAVAGNVKVGAGAFLDLKFSSVGGDLSVARGGQAAIVVSKVKGRLAAVAAQIEVDASEIYGELVMTEGGSLQAMQGEFDSPVYGSGAGLTVAIRVSQIRSNLRLDSGSALGIDSSQVGGDIFVGNGFKPPAGGMPIRIGKTQVSGDIKLRSGRAALLDRPESVVASNWARSA